MLAFFLAWVYNYSVSKQQLIERVGLYMLKSNKDKGFTIIEVVLVLAIAGLIFLTVFLALPALQKSQRDNARRQDVGNVVAALQAYLSDNNAVPVSGNTTFASYYGGVASLAQADTVTITAVTTGATVNTMIISSASKCPGETGATARNASVRIVLESGTTYCKSM